MSSIYLPLIQNWYKYYRQFNWRIYIKPYNIMIAEFMLQRTRADQVEPVYIKFLSKYPDVFTLAKAKYPSIAKFTETLGRHGRAQYFVDAAKYIVKNYNGEFPQTREELLEIPGVGDYVAGAILAICFNKADYVIDSNISRFINRYYNLGLTGEIRRKKIIIEKAKEIFKTDNQRDLLFALLDYTALVCKPINPDCTKCIFNKRCDLL